MSDDILTTSTQANLISLTTIHDQLSVCQVELCNDLSKAHSSYASWCFRQGRKSVSSNGTVVLTSSEIARVHAVVKEKERVAAVLAILSALNAEDAEKDGDDEELIAEDPEASEGFGMRAAAR